ncbi:DUF3148 domain-containing protein [Waterburya agarophytonicola K14]|uniref:DUF3148 domain-containing protein n=1 Tax=Waterburya agarophytonicola KI4 TaxID=2874699 RepID=A0A964FFU1_9CYAN|nr:DUF3148 domain-containing protein [Waterburya agarophytonicola]MCC0177402.1 DUF3148 domain-containing protein [Waterburya agarophytonicola KI4]
MSNEERSFKVGDHIKIVALPEYIKTAEPMPMLRSPSLLTIGELGTILDRRPGGYYGIRFTQGAFLLESQYIEAIDD